MQKDAFDGVFASRKRSFTLRMAPMIDMVFLLLIFFLVAAKWRPQENFLPFQLPVAQGQEHRLGKPEPLIIYISATQVGCQVQIGQFYTVQLEKQAIETNLTVLMERIKDCLVAQKRFTSDPIEIVSDASVRWEYLAKIYNVFFGAGLTDITFTMSEQPNNGNLH
jgi:biopolymer transport protein ExbD